MYTLLRTVSARTLALIQIPSFLSALLIAELFYKFHSFLLETGAFLATWLVLDAVLSGILTMIGGGRSDHTKTAP